MLFETLREIARAGKADVISGFFDALGGVTAEYSEGLGQTHIAQRLIDAGADVLFEKSIEVAGGNASVLRYFVDINTVLEIGVDKGARFFA